MTFRFCSVLAVLLLVFYLTIQFCISQFGNKGEEVAIDAGDAAQQLQTNGTKPTACKGMPPEVVIFATIPRSQPRTSLCRRGNISTNESPPRGGSTSIAGSPYRGGSTSIVGSPYRGGSTSTGGSPHRGGGTGIRRGFSSLRERGYSSSVGQLEGCVHCTHCQTTEGYQPVDQFSPRMGASRMVNLDIC